MTDRQLQRIGEAMACIEARAKQDAELRAALAVIAAWLGGIADSVAEEVPTPPAAMTAAPSQPAPIAETIIASKAWRQHRDGQSRLLMQFGGSNVNLQYAAMLRRVARRGRGSLRTESP